MEWSDQGIVLAVRPHGEAGAVASLLTRERGRHAGLVIAGRSSRLRGHLEPGSLVAARWRARLAEHLGAFTLEPLRGFAAGLLDEPERLAALTSACALVEAGLPEREPHPNLFAGLMALFELLDRPTWTAPGGVDAAWAEAYVRWEVGLLAELGFGLDLERCAVTGDSGPGDSGPGDSGPGDSGLGDNAVLAYVSPRSGRAVSAAAGEPYRDRLLALPGFLAGYGGGGPAEVVAGLVLTGHFLERHLLGHTLPPARQRLAERLGRRA